MFKKILFGIAFVASVVACTDDYKDWASPQVVDQPEDINFGNGSRTCFLANSKYSFAISGGEFIYI